MKNIFKILLFSGLLLSNACEQLDNFDEAEPCEKALGTTFPVFITQDFSPCSEIKTMELGEEDISETVRYFDYDVVNGDGLKFSAALTVYEFTTCESANFQYDLRESAETETEHPDTPSNISKIFDEAHLIYNVNEGNLESIVGRADNLLLDLEVGFLDCSTDWDSSVELFNNIGEKF